MGFAHLRKDTSMTPLAPCFGEPGARHARATPEHWNLGDHDYHEIVNHQPRTVPSRLSIKDWQGVLLLQTSLMIYSNSSISGTTGRLLLTRQSMLLPILSLTPSRAIADALASPTNEQFRLSRTTTTCTFITTFLLFELLHHLVLDATNTLSVRNPKDRANGDASDEGCRRLPRIFLQKRCTDILPFTATTQGVVSVFQ